MYIYMDKSVLWIILITALCVWFTFRHLNIIVLSKATYKRAKNILNTVQILSGLNHPKIVWKCTQPASPPKM